MRKSDWWIVVGLAVLALVVVAAMATLWKYKSTPGEAQAAPSEWPAASQLEHKPDLPTLVMFAHPQCPCTRASLAELRVLLSRFQGRVTAHVVFMLPEDVGEAWAKSDAWAIASTIPGLAIRKDPGRHESRLFGAQTSGDVALYSLEGRLLYSGGITGARGHMGNNAGRERVAALLDGHRADPHAPVFGCPLEDRP